MVDGNSNSGIHLLMNIQEEEVWARERILSLQQ